jgi:hypothetical protein
LLNLIPCVKFYLLNFHYTFVCHVSSFPSLS